MTRNSSPPHRATVAVANGLAQSAGRLRQQPVTGAVAVLIVDGLEALDVAEQHAVAPLARVELFEAVPAGRPVGDRGEWIGGGLAGQVSLPDPVGGHIDDLRYEVARPISRSVHDHDGEGAPHDASISGDVALVDTVETTGAPPSTQSQGHVGVQIVRVGDLLEGEFSQLHLVYPNIARRPDWCAGTCRPNRPPPYRSANVQAQVAESPLSKDVDFRAKQIGRLRGGFGGLEPMSDGPWPTEVKTFAPR